jgi:YegS/Rv2252/BmrU family lipid kinase
VEDAAAALEAYGITPDVWLTAGPGDATTLARRAVNEGYHLVVAAGGDGTVHEVAQPLVGTDVTLGIMPLGSVMNLARTLGIGRELHDAASIIAAGRAVRMDVGEARGRYFLEYGGVGLDAALIPLTAQMDLGRWSSFPALLRTVLRYRPRRLRIDVDGREFVTPALLIIIANTPFYLWAFELNPEARIDDRQFSIRIFSRFSLLELALYIFQIARGKRPYHPNLRTVEGRTVTVASSGRPMAAHADTHLIGRTPVTFHLIPNALRVLASPLLWSPDGPSVVTTAPVPPAGREGNP